jgi:hypothetical protein
MDLSHRRSRFSFPKAWLKGTQAASPLSQPTELVYCPNALVRSICVAAASPSIVLLSPGTIERPVAPGTSGLAAKSLPIIMLSLLNVRDDGVDVATGVDVVNEGETGVYVPCEGVAAYAAVPSVRLSPVNAIII